VRTRRGRPSAGAGRAGTLNVALLGAVINQGGGLAAAVASWSALVLTTVALAVTVAVVRAGCRGFVPRTGAAGGQSRWRFMYLRRRPLRAVVDELLPSPAVLAAIGPARAPPTFCFPPKPAAPFRQ
jgi:hypothetical protein